MKSKKENRYVIKVIRLKQEREYNSLGSAEPKDVSSLLIGH
jgi:hypothetical protein